SELDLLVAPDQVRELCQRDGAFPGLRAEVDERLLHERLILADQLPLDPAHARPAERVERGAAEPLRAREQPEDRVEPPPEPDLRLPAEGAEDRRVEVIVDPDTVRVLGADRGGEVLLEEEPSDLVL